MKNNLVRVLAVLAIVASLVLSINTSLAVGNITPTVLSPQSIQAAIDTRSLIVRNASSLRGAVEMQDALSVTGPATFADAITTTGGIVGPINSASALTVTGAATITGAVTSPGGFVGNVTGNVTGTLVGNASGAYLTATTSISAASVTVSGNLIVSGTQLFAGQTTESTNIIHSSALITPTNSGTITPSAKLLSMNPASDVTVTMATCTTGMETILYNQANFNVLIQDTGNGVLAGAQTLGQYDTLMLACIGTKWVQVSALSAN